MKKVIISIVLAIAILLGVFGTAVMAAPPDKPIDDWEDLKNRIEYVFNKIGSAVETSWLTVFEGLEAIYGKVVKVESDVAAVQNSIDGVSGNVSGFSLDITNVQNSVDGVQNGVDGLNSDVASVQTSVDGIQSSVDGLMDNMSVLQSLITDLADVGAVTDYQNGAVSVSTPLGSNTFDSWVIGDYDNPKHVSLTLQPRGMDSTDYISIWTRVHPSDSTATDKNIRYVFELEDFSGPSWVQQIEFDAIEWAIQVHDNDEYDDWDSAAINLTWAATETSYDYQNGAVSVSTPLGSNTFERWVIGDYDNPKHVSLTLQPRGMDSTDYISIWTRVHPSDSTDTDKNIRYVFELEDFSGPSWVQQIEFDAIEWAIQVHDNDEYDDWDSAAINLTWAATGN